MSRVPITVRATVAAIVWWVMQTTPIHAQIASYIDGSGRLTYVNAEPPAKRHASSKRNGLKLGAPTAYDPSTVIVREPPDQLDRIVRDAAERNNVDPALVRAVINTESGWNPAAISRKGALGLMQLEPETAGRLGVNQPFDPAQNVEGGTRYLRTLLDRYNGDLEKSLAAYNAGEGAVERFGGVPNYRETRAYVQKVTNTYFRPGSGRDLRLWDPPKSPVRKTVDEHGRVVFTNE
jgi:soluble lytic murein transglycosylase-like protein